MNLKAQILDLVQHTPEDILEPLVMEKVVVPLLVAQAKKLNLAHVYIWSNEAGERVLLTLENCRLAQQIPGVIYAFARSEDAKSHPEYDPAQLILMREPILRLLFEVLTHPQVNLLWVFRPGGHRHQVDTVYKTQLKKTLTEKAPLILREMGPDYKKVRDSSIC